ncbi:MAG: MarR family transcriptional regulator [Lachnospiraceae bacterium]
MDSYIKYLDESMGKLITYANLIDQVKHDCGIGILLSPPEIHLLEAIVNHPGYNTTNLGEVIGLLKGTLSKRAKHLEDLKLITKYQIAGNKKEIFYEVTPLGKIAYEGHYKYHDEVSAPFYKWIKEQPKEDLEVFLNFVQRYTEYLKDYLK